MSIVVVGTVAFDSIETPFGSVDKILGGSATYITLAARYFTPAPRLVAVVGSDFPIDYVTLLEERGIDTQGLVVNEEEETFFWAGRYHYDLNTRDTLATHLNALATFDPVLPPAYRASRIVCLGNLDPAIQHSVLDQVDEPDLVICDTMNYWIESTPDGLAELLGRIDILIINDEEARQLADEPNLVRAARLIRERGPDTLIIKKGEHGALLFTDDTIFSAPAFPLEDIHDPTGAGDAFMGGLAGFLASREHYDDEDLKRAIVYGSALASFVVERFGPDRLLDLTPAEINTRISAFQSLSAIPAMALTLDD